MKRSELSTLIVKTNAAFAAEINNLVACKMLKKSKAEDIKAGHADGMRNMWVALVAQNELHLEDDPK